MSDETEPKLQRRATRTPLSSAEQRSVMRVVELYGCTRRAAETLGVSPPTLGRAIRLEPLNPVSRALIRNFLASAGFPVGEE